MRKSIFAAAAVAAAFISAPAAAATLITSDTTGKVTGVNGLEVNGTLYNATFVDGTCESVFGTCEVASFDFKTQGDASRASFALVQFFNSLGSSRPNPWDITGCPVGVSSYSQCNMLTPYVGPSDPNTTIFSSNRATLFTAGADTLGHWGMSADANHNNSVLVRWTPAAISAVPEPSTWAMMLVGFGGIGFAMRRAKKADGKLAIA